MTSRPEDPRAPRARSARRKFGVLGLVLAVAFVGGWGYLLYGSPVFAAKTVEVTGTERLSAAQVEDAAAVPEDMPLARVDVAAVESRVLRLAKVKTVLVQRHWPNTVRIDVTERTPVATVSRNGTWWLVDEDAVVVATTSKKPRLPVLDVANPSPDDASTRSALEVVDRLPRSLSRKVRTVTAESRDAVELHLRGNVDVVWGNAQESAKKARVLAALRKAEPKGSVYDVSTPDTATVVR